MLEYFNEFMTIGVIGLLGAMSPGPDFVVVCQYSLCYGRKAGIFTALGVALGCLVHLSYCIVGIGMIVAESIFWFNVIKYIGCAYLLYLGWQALTAKAPLPASSTESTETQVVPLYAAFKKGFLINLLNPKATLFFLSVFSQVIDPHTPRVIQVGLGAEFALIAFSWFSFLAIILSFKLLRTKLQQCQHGFEKLMGGALVVLGLKVATLTQ